VVRLNLIMILIISELNNNFFFVVSEESDVGLEEDKLIPLNPDNIINLEEESEIKKNK
jgi:hypothetical protein